MIDSVTEEAVSKGARWGAPPRAASPQGASLCTPRPRSNGYLCAQLAPPAQTPGKNGAAPRASDEDEAERGLLLPPDPSSLAAPGFIAKSATELSPQQLRLHENPLCEAAPASPRNSPRASPTHTIVEVSRLCGHPATTTTTKRKSGRPREVGPVGLVLRLGAGLSGVNRFALAAGAVILLGALALLVMCAASYSCAPGPESHTCLSEECVRTAASLLSAMDRSASPCQDFFQYACGSWNKRHLIPEDRSSISTFEVLAEQLNHILKGILDEDVNVNDSNATKKAKIFYKSCMDLNQIRKVGDVPLKKVLTSLGGWPVTVPGWKPPEYPLEVLLGRLRELSEGVLFQQWVGPDDKNSSVNILQLDQLQLALPSRDYYLKTSTETEIKAYHKYVTEVAMLMGADKATVAQEITEVINFEKRLAEASLPEADRHDTSLNYQQLPLWRLQEDVPELDWHLFLKTVLKTDISREEPVVCYGLPYFRSMGKILAETDRRVVHNYVLWRLVMTVIPHMIDEYASKRVEFRRVLHGILSERPRWAQCVELTNKKLGMAVGALFIRDNFNHESKETALEMIHNIRGAFNELLAENAWMDDETRAVAKEKADAMNERIGYPDMLTNPAELNQEYIMLNVTPGQFLVNILNVLRYEAYHNFQNLRQPVNRDKWSTEPVVVNAFYNPNKNDIMFPAGILQPLFYSKYFPKSLNYGGIGVVIGHEITHGFDDKGRQFDKDGNLMQWWNNATVRAFRERAQCIVDQYNRYRLPDITSFINGRMTQGENIADNGGLKQSFRAYRKWVAKHGEEPRLPGINLTHNQLFFLNYAQIWCGSMRPEDALSKVRSSVHPPGPIRVLGPLSNSNDFAEAFDCPLGSPMNPADKCSVW